MGVHFRMSFIRLALIALLSSLGLGVQAHEVTPTIGELTMSDGRVTLNMRMNIEAFVARIDLDGMTDTNDAAEAEDYDALRALDTEELSSRVAQFAPDWLNTLQLEAGGTAVALSVVSIEIPDVGNIELPRYSHLTVGGDVPEGATAMVLSWPKGGGGLVLRQMGVEDPYTGFLTGGEVSPEIAFAGGGASSGWVVFLDYIPVGFDHILPKGLDHILFVLGLFFLSLKLGALLWQISAFTVAHTVTLALGATGVVVISPSIVEPLIAASIVYVAVENIFARGLNPWRPALVFAFGLLHGLGFAGVLGEFGLPEGQFIPALLGFNIGVELGQLAVIAIAFLAVGLWFGQRAWYRPRIAVPASVAIALVGSYWVVERVFL